MYFRNSQRENLAAGRLSIQLKLEDWSLHPPSLPSAYLVPSNTFTLNPYMTKSSWWDLNCFSSPSAPSAIKFWTTTENVDGFRPGLLCICWKIAARKPCSRTPNLTSRPNMNEQPGWCVFLKCLFLLLRCWSYCVRSCRPILWPQFSSGSCSQAKEVTFPRGASCDGPATHPACISVTGC